MDIWIGISKDNAQKLVLVLKEFGFELPEVNESLFLQEKKVLRMGNARHPDRVAHPLSLELNFSPAIMIVSKILSMA